MNRVCKQASCATAAAVVALSLVLVPSEQTDPAVSRPTAQLVQLAALVSSSAIDRGQATGATTSTKLVAGATTRTVFPADRAAAKAAAAFDDVDTSSPLYVAVYAVSILLSPLYYIAFPITFPVGFVISSFFNPDVLTTALATALFPLNFPRYLVRVLTNVAALPAQSSFATAQSSASDAAEPTEPPTEAALAILEHGGAASEPGTQADQVGRPSKRVRKQTIVATRTAPKSASALPDGSETDPSQTNGDAVKSELTVRKSMRVGHTRRSQSDTGSGRVTGDLGRGTK
jgi:hypothetical protein